MLRLSMNETTTFRWSFEEDVTNYVAAGIPAIGVWRPKLSDFGEEKGIELLKDSNLKASHLLWAGGFTGSDGRSFRESVDDAKEALKTASALGAPPLVIYSGPRAGHTNNHARRLLKEAVAELTPLAIELNVKLALEPMHPNCADGWTFLTSLDDTLELLEELDCPQAKMVFDTYHLCQNGLCINRIEEIVPQIAIVQLGDAKRPPCGEQNRCQLGEGTIPLKEIVNALCDAGYDGFYDIELLGEDVETSDYQSLLKHAKETFIGE